MFRRSCALVLVVTACLAACGKEEPKAATATAPKAADTSFPPAKGPVRTTFRIVTTGLSPKAWDAVAAGARVYFTEKRKPWDVVLTPPGPILTGDEPINAIITCGDGSNIPAIPPSAKAASDLPIVLIEPVGTPKEGAFTVRTEPGGADAPPAPIADQLLADLRAGKSERVTVPDYFEIGRRSAEIAHQAIVAEGKRAKMAVKGDQTVPALVVTKENLEEPHVKALLGIK